MQWNRKRASPLLGVAMSRIAKCTWGAAYQQTWTLFTAVIAPRMDYVAIIAQTLETNNLRTMFQTWWWHNVSPTYSSSISSPSTFTVTRTKLQMDYLGRDMHRKTTLKTPRGHQQLLWCPTLHNMTHVISTSTDLLHLSKWRGVLRGGFHGRQNMLRHWSNPQIQTWLQVELSQVESSLASTQTRHFRVEFSKSWTCTWLDSTRKSTPILLHKHTKNAPWTLKCYKITLKTLQHSNSAKMLQRSTNTPTLKKCSNTQKMLQYFMQCCNALPPKCSDTPKTLNKPSNTPALQKHSKNTPVLSLQKRSNALKCSKHHRGITDPQVHDINADGTPHPMSRTLWLCRHCHALGETLHPESSTAIQVIGPSWTFAGLQRYVQGLKNLCLQSAIRCSFLYLH